MIFVTTGTFGFTKLIAAIDRMAESGAIREHVIAQIGHSRHVPRHVEYFRTTPHIRRYMDGARFVIAHGGTGSILELMQLGKKIIGVPNAELADNHQQLFLETLHRRGAILYAPAPDPALLAAQLELVDRFQPVPFSFYPPPFIELLRKDIAVAAPPA